MKEMQAAGATTMRRDCAADTGGGFRATDVMFGQAHDSKSIFALFLLLLLLLLVRDPCYAPLPIFVVCLSQKMG